MGRGRLLVGVLLVVAVVATSCSSGSDQQRQSVDVPEEQGQAESNGESPGEELDTFPSNGLDDIAGLIATGGPNGLNIVKPTGEVVAEFFDGRTATQPTWSRDGSRLVATFIDEATGESQVGVLDLGTFELVTSAARRPYYFYTWSADGTTIAALGPGVDEAGQDGISADLLDATGRPLSDTSLIGGSVFMAWEPDGSDLLVHIGPKLIMITDASDLGGFVDLGLVGNQFQAPSWIPGTREVVYVQNLGPDHGRIVRLNVDTFEAIDLGRAWGFTFFSINPDGESMVIAQSQFVGEGDGVRLETVDLATGDHEPMSDELGMWLEWSPDGENLLVATSDDEQQLSWGLWDGAAIMDLGLYNPPQFYRLNYLRFADAYVESQRLWSPDGEAVIFVSEVDGAVPVTSAIRVDDGTRVELGNSEVAFWSPVDVPLAAGS